VEGTLHGVKFAAVTNAAVSVVAAVVAARLHPMVQLAASHIQCLIVATGLGRSHVVTEVFLGHFWAYLAATTPPDRLPDQQTAVGMPVDQIVVILVVHCVSSGVPTFCGSMGTMTVASMLG
jgi:hypothetical protein